MVSALKFWSEDAAWPLAHYLIPASLYFAIRNPWITLLLAYVWESVEFLLSSLRADKILLDDEQKAPFERLNKKDDNFFSEPDRSDSLIGDPLQALLSVMTFYFADTFLGWTPPDGLFSPMLRLGAVAAVTATWIVADYSVRCCNRKFRYGALIYGIIYIGSTLAFYGGAIAHAADNVQTDKVWQSIGAWLTVAAVQTLNVVMGNLCCFRPALQRVYSRVFFVGLVALLAASIAVTVTEHSASVQE